MSLINITIEGIPYQVEEGLTILEAARRCGYEIPSLCAFNHGECNQASCRVCLVKVNTSRSLVASCVYPVSDGIEISICDPMARWKEKTMENFRAVELQVPIFRNGELVYRLPSLPEIKSYCADQVETLWPEVLRFDYPHQYYVDLSEKLMAMKDEMLRNAGRSGQEQG